MSSALLSQLAFAASFPRVREYVSDLLALFECDNRTQVVLKARRLGFILD